MINYEGLQKRPTFEGIVDYLANKQEKVKYPDRFAKQIRDHPYLTQFEGEGFLEVEELDRKRAEQEYIERTARQFANQNNVSAQVARVVTQPPGRLDEPRTQGRSTRGSASSSGPSAGQPKQLQEFDEYRPQADSALQSTVFRSFETDLRRVLSDRSSSSALPSNLDTQMEDVTRQTQERVEAERKAKQARDKATVERLTTVNLTGIRSSESVVDRFMPDTDMQTGGSSGSAGPMNESTEQKRSGQPTGESPARAKAKASSSSSSSAPEAPKLAIPDFDYPSRPKIKRLDADAKKAYNEGVMDQDTYDYYQEVRAQYDEALKNKDKKKQEELKAELIAIVIGGDLGPTKAQKKTKGVKKTIEKEKPNHGTPKDNNTDRTHWEQTKITKAYIINQLGLRGDRNPKSLKRKPKAELIDMILEAIKNDKK